MTEPHNEPKIIPLDRKVTCLLIDVSIISDINVIKKMVGEKVQKYKCFRQHIIFSLRDFANTHHQGPKDWLYNLCVGL
jgi:hypothetical protein